MLANVNGISFGDLGIISRTNYNMIAYNLACAGIFFEIFCLEHVFDFVLNSVVPDPLKTKNVILLVNHV